MNFKLHLTIDEQISHLKENKKVVFNDYNYGYCYLKNNNYFNFINPTKYHFTINYENYKNIYETSNFDNWVEIDQRYKNLELDIIRLILQKERIIKSLLIEYINEEFIKYSESKIVKEFINRVCFRNKTKFIEKGYLIDNKLSEEIKLKICNSIYTYINTITLSDLVILLKKTTKSFRKSLSKDLNLDITKNNNLDYLIELRNKMAHNRALIYFFLNKKLDVTVVYKRYLFLNDLVKDNELIINLYKIVMKYNRMKKNKKIGLKKN